MMQSTMQDFPLNVGMIFRHGRALHGDREVVTFEGDCCRRASFAEVAGFVAKWQLPERWAFIDEVPKTTVGKFDKEVLRARYAAGDLVVEEL